MSAARPILRPGDLVDVVAPGFRCAEESVTKAVAWLRELGLKARVPPDLFGKDLLCANTDAVRFKHLRRALDARDSRVVWCMRAGYGAIRLIERLRGLSRPRHRKLFVGYSDATTIHYFLNLHWRWPSLHGPLLDRLGSGGIGTDDMQELRDVLFADRGQVSFTGLRALNAAARRPRRIEGHVFGGNLTVLQTTRGTALQRPLRGILFLEDIGERGYRVDRMLQHLAQAGALDNLAAMVLGSFVGGDEADGSNLIEPVLQCFSGKQRFPVLAGLPAGHGARQRPVFLATRAELRCGPRPQLTIDVPRLGPLQ
jgi:muramoyltetrapeptide carboxypeptidase